MSHSIEIVNAKFPCGPFRAAIFDFDGTLSLIRRGWQDVMIPMMVEILQEVGSNESEESLTQLVTEFVTRLTGRQTIYQMIELAEQVVQRGGTPLDPLDYKQEYHRRLWAGVEQRIATIRNGKVAAETMTILGSQHLIEQLVQSGLTLYLASGTDIDYVRDELELLELHSHFGERVYGALDDYKKFSKAMLIHQIIRDTGVTGSQLIGFGDGYVEIEEIKRVGGLAIGVASDEYDRQGVDEWKRDRLIQAGADIIVPNYQQHEELLSTIGVML
ncbi:MAG: HAD family hydrolase [Pirellulales bacterium]|nr:HAD family hydrolase [Pirellulales bacterium]